MHVVANAPPCLPIHILKQVKGVCKGLCTCSDRAKSGNAAENANSHEENAQQPIFLLEVRLKHHQKPAIQVPNDAGKVFCDNERGM